MGGFDKIIQKTGMTAHYQFIMKGIIDTKDVVYFLSMIVLFMYAALTVIKSLKK